MVKVHNFAKKGTQIQKQAAAIHSNSKKTGKKLNRAIKKTARKLRKTKHINYQRQKKERPFFRRKDGSKMFVARQQCDPISYISKTKKRKAKILRRKLEKIERQRVVNKGDYAFCEGFLHMVHTLVTDDFSRMKV